MGRALSVTTIDFRRLLSKDINQKPVIMKRMALTAVLGLFILSCSKETIVGSGNLVSEEREVSSFGRISNDGIIDLDFTLGDTDFVQITADDNIIDKVRTRVVNGELLLDLDGDSFRDIQVKATITGTRLKGFRNTGTGNAVVRSITGEDNFTLFNSGTGNIELGGDAVSLMLENEGSGDIKAFNLVVQEADITLIGSGNCELTCTDAMNVYIEGSGNVYYKGNPSIQVQVEGSGEVIDSN